MFSFRRRGDQDVTCMRKPQDTAESVTA